MFTQRAFDVCTLHKLYPRARLKIELPDLEKPRKVWARCPTQHWEGISAQPCPAQGLSVGVGGLPVRCRHYKGCSQGLSKVLRVGWRLKAQLSLLSHVRDVAQW